MNRSFCELLTSVEAQLFIKHHQHEKVENIILKYSGKTSLPLKEIVEQIKCHNRAGKKLPSLSEKKILYKTVPLEQASSELTADYKSSLVTGKRIIDLTGGLGIDDIFFSTKFDEVVYCELDSELAEIAQYNFRILGINNITVRNSDSIAVLKLFPDDSVDLIYADPARRDENRRSVDLKYCKPDILRNLDLLFRKSQKVMLKLAPAFDYTEATRLFPMMTHCYVISVNNECKEILLILERNANHSIVEKNAVVLNANTMPYLLSSNDYSKECNDQTLIKGEYLYIPDVAVRKADLVSKLCGRYGVNRFSEKSEYLSSKEIIDGFPGRIQKIIDTFQYNQKNVLKYLKTIGIKKANISRNNFPDKPESLRKKLKLKEGGEDYLLFTSASDEKLIFIHTKRI